MPRITVTEVRAMKGKEKVPMLTAYDYTTAKLLDEVGMPLILVGDSLGMVMLGYESTIPVTMEEMLHHTRAVVRGSKRAVVIGDMPFMTYHISIAEALRNAARFLQEGQVPGQVPGVAGQVLPGAELGGVDKDAHGGGVVFTFGAADQGQVPLVEIAHGGDKAQGAGEALPPGPELGHGADNFHVRFFPSSRTCGSIL